jgi:hypothetical protein
MDINALTKDSISTISTDQDPEKWGPHTWATIHSFALRSDTLETIDSFLLFLTTLGTLIPCSVCRNDFADYLRSNRPISGSAFKWTIDFHNHVNRKIGKPIVNYEQALKLWTSNSCQYTCTKKTKSKKFDKKFAPYLALLLILVLIVLYFYKQWKPLNSN